MKWMKFVCVIALTAVVSFLLGWLWRGGVSAPAGEHVHEGAPAAKSGKPALWTCPMHPQIQQPDPGQCPICGMDLVQPEAGAEDPGPRRLRMSEAGKKLAEIETTPVARKFVETAVRMVGMVDYDETRVQTISAWVPGRLDRLYVDFTGTRVRKGDHLVWQYSPELLTAQQELLEQKRLLSEATNERSEFLRKSTLEGLEAARDKLRLWGLSDDQIEAIEKRGKTEDHVMIPSPTEGIVIHKGVNQGDYVKTGTPIYRIARLDKLWLQLDAYESDLPWVRYGQDVAIETDAHPGEIFHGWISFVSPELDRKTRTVKVRVNVDNEDERLKPGMFVRAIVRARLAGGGKVMDPRLAGKWFCPMHPEVVEDAQKPCRICGMDLVPAEKMGYVAAKEEAKPLVVPATAVLWTGKRSVVYVEVPGQEKSTYEGREIILGPRAGDHYILLAGLEDGERIVTNGNFKIDSALQIRAKPSMIRVHGESRSKARVPAAFRQSLSPLWARHFEIADALASDDLDAAKRAFAGLGEAVNAVRAVGLPPQAHSTWLREADELAESVVAASKADVIAGVRAAFLSTAGAMLEIEETIGHSGTRPHFEVYCPMAFDGKGATWLQQRDGVRNPFYGVAMLACGEVRGVHPASGREQDIPAVVVPVKPASRNAEHDGHGAHAAPDGAEVRVALEPVYAAYLRTQRALAADEAAGAASGFGDLAKAVAGVDMKLFAGDAHAEWMQRSRELLDAAKRGRAAKDIDGARVAFKSASDAVLALIARFGHSGGSERSEVYCPMSFDGGGGAWLQEGAQTSNPYYGASMLRCGSKKRSFPAAKERR